MLYSQLRWIAPGLALAVSACATPIDKQDLAFAPAPPAEEATLVVRSSYFGEVNIYVVAGATRARIGSVPAGGSRDLHIPRAVLTRPEIQFQVDPVGPIEPFTFRPIPVEPGKGIELTVAPALQMSSYAIVVNR